MIRRRGKSKLFAAEGLCKLEGDEDSDLTIFITVCI